MPSRSIPLLQSPPLITPSPAQSRHHRPLHSHLVPPIAAASSVTLSLLLFLSICFRKLTRKRTAPADSKPPHSYSYSVLRRATDSFSPSLRLGQGGFGPVFRGTLPAANNEAKQIAVKVMDSGSLQGEREFQNEIFFASKLDSDHIVSVLGFSSDRKRRRMLLVYELMSNGNLQDALLRKKCPELRDWKRRFSVVLDIAKGIQYLHGLSPPVIHGDIKPSNILLDQYFSAKISDFGLARLREEKNLDQCDNITVVSGGSEAKFVELERKSGVAVEDNGSVMEETESVTTIGVEEANLGVDQSPESIIRASPPGSMELAENGNVIGEGIRSSSVRDPSSKRENGVVVKDYVMEWIGTDLKEERPTSNWIAASSSSSTSSAKLDKKNKNKKRWDWWVSLDDDKEKNSKSFKKEKRRPAREWWKEEYCEELAKKKKKKKRQMGIGIDDDWCPSGEELYVDRKKKSRSRSRSRSSRGSTIDWWLDGLSGELFKGRGNSLDSVGGEVPKSVGISSTPSMRGTVCYVAPEYGDGGGDLSEKCDVYSFGVLLLVLISGRRPLQVTESPMSEFQRANLLSWARHLARNGKLIDLVDQGVLSLDREQALLCITVALLCLQKSPTRRPSMKEVVAMLTGESQAPQLPTEFSPSPPSRFPYKSHKKAR
ncbi:Pkinase domain-containing protein/Pkinase_Tyr domain-containing protein [Cephalotus follicularis]|uniref:Pkinase domain-containing protein/Pkinase_Tyr domain-containing protein n=1 Tax=Cephalotus follicularis TaxID=3775 RepID=A0A1Q3B1F6_CEPFO|nr:Pkinase domain-containing protein/Pkinase_Tyr domain-containing protein [Cephalotus follicularis]